MGSVARLARALPTVLVLAGCHAIWPLARPADGARELDMFPDARVADVSRPDAVQADAAAADSTRADTAAPDLELPDAAATEAGTCAITSAWDCPSSASYYCKASCGSKQINCGTSSCTCVGETTPCYYISPPVYCAACMQAVKAGCCQ